MGGDARKMRTLVASHGILEPLVAAHAHEMFEVLRDPAIYEFENAPPASEAWLTQRYAKLESRRSADGSEHWLNWVIRLPGGALAGYVQATVLPSGAAFVAYELNSRYWRRGIASSALRAVLDELRAGYDARDFVAVLKARNFRSEALLRKLGFAHGDTAQHVAYRDEPDEIVMVRKA